MKEIITKLLLANMELTISKFSAGICEIRVTSIHKVKGRPDPMKSSMTQCLPMDNHLDYALEGAIDYCYNELIKLILESKEG